MAGTSGAPYESIASSIDYGEYLRTRLPYSRMPYILARAALADNGFSAEVAFRALYQSEDLEPPLSVELKEQIGAVIRRSEKLDKFSLHRPATTLLLAWAVDHGSIQHNQDQG